MTDQAKAIELAKEFLADADTRARVKVALATAGFQLAADMIDEAVIVSRALLAQRTEEPKAAPQQPTPRGSAALCANVEVGERAGADKSGPPSNGRQGELGESQPATHDHGSASTHAASAAPDSGGMPEAKPLPVDYRYEYMQERKTLTYHAEDYDTLRAYALSLLEKREGMVMVPRKLLVRIWGFLAQDCTPCAAEDCQIGGKNTGVDQLVDEIKPLLVAAPREEGK